MTKLEFYQLLLQSSHNFKDHHIAADTRTVLAELAYEERGRNNSLPQPGHCIFCDNAVMVDTPLCRIMPTDKPIVYICQDCIDGKESSCK
jgi:hypothetical protein